MAQEGQRCPEEVNIFCSKVLRIRGVYPRSGFFPIPDPTPKRRVKNLFIFIVAINFTKFKNYLVFELVQGKLESIDKNSSIIYMKIVT
jgi:hypothetical protein